MYGGQKSRKDACIPVMPHISLKTQGRATTVQDSFSTRLDNLIDVAVCCMAPTLVGKPNSVPEHMTYDYGKINKKKRQEKL